LAVTDVYDGELAFEDIPDLKLPVREFDLLLTVKHPGGVDALRLEHLHDTRPEMLQGDVKGRWYAIFGR